MLYWYGAAALILILQFLLSRRTYAWPGAIMPTLYVLGFVLMLSTQQTKGSMWSMLIAGIGGTAFLLGMWDHGRKAVHQKQQREETKIKARNLS